MSSGVSPEFTMTAAEFAAIHHAVFASSIPPSGVTAALALHREAAEAISLPYSRGRKRLA